MWAVIVIVWAVIHHDGRTALVGVNGALSIQIYRDEILHHHTVPLINVSSGTFSITMPHHTWQKSVEIFYSKTTFMFYYGQQD